MNLVDKCSNKYTDIKTSELTTYSKKMTRDELREQLGIGKIQQTHQKCIKRVKNTYLLVCALF